MQSTSNMASYPVVTHGLTAQEILDRNGLGLVYYCKCNTPGDGNCFWHAIVDQLTDDEIRGSVAQWAREIPLNHLVVRQRVTDFALQYERIILSDDTIFNMLLFMENEEKLSNPPGRDYLTIYRDYIQKMSQPRE